MNHKIANLKVTADDMQVLDGNISLGRALTSKDIVTNSHGLIHPISLDEGEVLCFCCQENQNGTRGLQPLTPETGVFTSAYECSEGAPAWVCFSCMGWSSKQFDWLTPECQEILTKASERKHKIESAMSAFNFSFIHDGINTQASETGVTEEHARKRVCIRHNIPLTDMALLKLNKAYHPRQ